MIAVPPRAIMALWQHRVSQAPSTARQANACIAERGRHGADVLVLGDLAKQVRQDWAAAFTVTVDLILLDNLIFTVVDADGPLAAGAMHDSGDRIIDDTEDGTLSYHADGSGEEDAIRFARPSRNPTLSATDFVVI